MTIPAGSIFEGTPLWYSGAGTRRKTIWENPEKQEIAETFLTRAREYGLDPIELYNSAVYAGWKDDQPFPERIFEGITPGSGTVPHIVEIFRQDRKLPGMDEKFGPYEEQPGILKRVADIAAGHLIQRASMKPSERVYPGERLAPLHRKQKRAYEMLGAIGDRVDTNRQRFEDAQRALDRLQYGNPLSRAQEYLGQGTTTVSPEERSMFRESAMNDIVNPLHAKMRRELLENILPQIDANRIQHGNLYGGGRERLRQKALDDLQRNMMETALPHLFEAEQRGQQAGERQRQAQINAGQILAPASVQAAEAQRQAAISSGELLQREQLHDLAAA